MADKYASFEDMLKHEKKGVDFKIRHEIRGSAVAILAPHGGGIEPGTSELAQEIASKDLTYYIFEGIKLSNNQDLHITSTRFREPECDKVVRACSVIVAIHGASADTNLVFLGGKDDATAVEANRLRRAIEKELEIAGFAVSPPPSHILGKENDNLCNRGRSGAGVQLELCRGVRAAMFANVDSRKGREVVGQPFRDFVAAIRNAVV
jgi:phage replication-related protein YjqB (UPF0714/DUF867 family)